MLEAVGHGMKRADDLLNWLFVDLLSAELAGGCWVIGIFVRMAGKLEIVSMQQITGEATRLP